MTWRPATASDLTPGARVGYRGIYGLASMRKGKVEGERDKSFAAEPVWDVRLDSDGQTRWGYLDQFYVEDRV